jgi:hypothetical protein
MNQGSPGRRRDAPLLLLSFTRPVDSHGPGLISQVLIKDGPRRVNHRTAAAEQKSSQPIE